MSGNVLGTIGAKVLQKQEIMQSLPTYEKLKEQIESVRPQAKEYRSMRKKQLELQDEFALPQVINNFSILGSRGTGKSSILKTLSEDLKRENNEKVKNLILPMIIPENLVQHVSLMGCILGLLKEPVDRICKEHKKENLLCPSGQHPLGKKYFKLMEEFVQLQQPYEQISVQQFSTNSEYVNTMTSVFEAGNQFTIRFREFIDELLNQYNEDALLFIFIDDVDLSTYRCGDIVKTLLSYLSHPSIVTILAGDIAVFGEALTLDFMRQEQIPDTMFMNGTFLIEESQYKLAGYNDSNEKLLQRKKQLAYEYLKKVLPPNNRHIILNWSLATKGNFCSAMTDTEKPNVTLAQLLYKLGNYVPLLRNYYLQPLEKDTDNDLVFGKNGRKRDMLLYYPFDITARGLANSYYAIRSLVEKLDANGKQYLYTSQYYSDIKFLVESIVASNYTFSAYREIIFNQFIDLGRDLNHSAVHFDNYYMWIMQELPYLMILESPKKEPNFEDNDKKIEMEKVAFQIFVLLDMVARLLGAEDTILEYDLTGKKKNSNYVKAKETVLFLLGVNKYINEGNECLNAEQRSTLKNIKNHFIHYGNVTKILDAYFDLIFPVAIRYFQDLDISSMLEQTNEKRKFSHVIYLEYAVSYVKSLKLFYENCETELGRYIKFNPNMHRFLENYLDREPENILLGELCGKYFLEKSQLYSKYIESGYGHQQENWIIEPFYNAFIQNPNQLIFHHKQIEKLDCYFSKQSIYTPKNNKQTKVIFAIDRKDAWNIDRKIAEEDNFISLITQYIEAKMHFMEIKILKYIDQQKDGRQLGIIISDKFKEAYEEFMKSYDGVSTTKSYLCKLKLKKILLEPEVSTGSIKKQIRLTEYIDAVSVLNTLICSRARYGIKEARKTREELQSCAWNIFQYNVPLIYEYFFWLHSYCRYQLANQMGDLQKLIDQAALARTFVNNAMQSYDKVIELEYINVLSNELGISKDLIQDIPTLFSTSKLKANEVSNDNT